MIHIFKAFNVSILHFPSGHFALIEEPSQIWYMHIEKSRMDVCSCLNNIMIPNTSVDL